MCYKCLCPIGKKCWVLWSKLTLSWCTTVASFLSLVWVFLCTCCGYGAHTLHGYHTEMLLSFCRLPGFIVDKSSQESHRLKLKCSKSTPKRFSSENEERGAGLSWMYGSVLCWAEHHLSCAAVTLQRKQPTQVLHAHLFLLLHLCGAGIWNKGSHSK